MSLPPLPCDRNAAHTCGVACFARGARWSEASRPSIFATQLLMGIVGERPESGVRIALERDKQAGPPWNYRGAAHVPDASFECSVVVSHQGEVDVTLPSDAPPDLPEKVRLIVRAVYRQASAHGNGEPPAWKIVRWRGEK